MPSAQYRSLDSLCPLLDRFPDLRLVVWGDLVADRFLVGSTHRVSREAPALVVRQEREELALGAAGNAAANVAALGGRAHLAGYLGEDRLGEALRHSLRERGVETSAVIARTDSATPVKTRVMAGGSHTVRQQILRIDDDRPWPASGVAEDDLLARLGNALEDADALLISDYGLGTVSPSRYPEVRALAEARGIPISLDSRHRLMDFPAVTVATPNEEEVEWAVRQELEGDAASVEAAGRRILEHTGADDLVITRGSCGMAVFSSGEVHHLPIHRPTEVADVTGAGDTVIASLTLALAAGADMVDAARLANAAAWVAVTKRGTASVSTDELAAALREVG